MTRISTIFVLLLTTLPLFGQRIQRTINESWDFAQGNSTECIKVNLPHTWNNIDAADEVSGYYRGKGTYTKTLYINESIEEHSFTLHFEGANQETAVKVNGEFVGVHQGGYSAFSFNITDKVQQGRNTIEIEVDNSHNADIPPLSADFTFWGGIYRDLSLIITPKVHLSTTHYATSGVYIDTEDEDKNKAAIRIRTFVSNDSDISRSVILRHNIFSPEGAMVASQSKKIKIVPLGENICSEVSMKIDSPVLWNTESPALYRVVTTLEYEGGNDIVTEHFGFRWFSFDPENGFRLNGKPVKLIGTSRHQDYYGKGNALGDEMHVRDVKLLKDMGGNFLRISHYPQDPIVSQMCDKLGILTSIEIPVINSITMTPQFHERCIEMTKEMIWQDYNSPSVIMWAYMNEIMLRPPYDKKDENAKKTYTDYLFSIASDIETIIRELDPKRYTMLPCHSNPDTYEATGITSLPKILGWNVYSGWYGSKLDNLAIFLDKVHERFPNQSHIISEYGADVDPRIHSFAAERFDFSCEFGLKFHMHYIKDILSRDWLAGAAIWNLNDFYSEVRQDAVPRINNKGITGVDRELKDSYHLYKAWLSKRPFIKIGTGTWKYRGGVVDSCGICRQNIEVYTNAADVELYHNGESLGRKQVMDRHVTFEVPFIDGENVIYASACCDDMTIQDMITTNFSAIPYSFSQSFESMNVMLGSNRYFEDREAQIIWIPEQEYTTGSWGYVGGKAYRAKTRHGSLPASDLEIIGTAQDPIFQTQRVNIESFKADIPNGRYYIYLYFAEFESSVEQEAIAYNLGNDIIREHTGDRVFDVSINGLTVLNKFCIAEECGAQRAVIKKFTIDIHDGNGLSINFTPISGKCILNAIRIYKCH